jgi:glycosyltransferase involved in cell wall biosynthesis
MLGKLLDSISHRNDCELIIINDGDPIQLDGYNYYVHTNEHNSGVAKSKNKALKHLLDLGCEHIFLIEDDMLIKNDQIFEAYIKASKVTGIQHMMFGYHGPANKNGISKGKPCPRLVVKYSDDVSIALNQHCVGAFCYYTRKSLEDCGLIDEKFKNAFDHVSHSYELALKGYSTPYWWWADLENSCDYIEEQACSEESSTIKTPEKQEQWWNNIQESMKYFKEKFGVMPFGDDRVPDKSEAEVLQLLKSVKV